MRFVTIESIAKVSAAQWDGLHQSDNPFVAHAFLAALEANGCVSERFGWRPKHLLAYQGDELVAALPLYEKHNNYGEFVFDHAWHQAWQSVGLAYYPKLVCAVPYTPALGPRVLISSTNPDRPVIFNKVIEYLKTWTAANGLSGFHVLFSQEQSLLSRQPEMLCRHDVQFQWFNQGFANFDAFLATLKPKKRKNIRQERKAIHAQGLTFQVLDGQQATENDWHDFTLLYQKTFLEKYSTPTLNLGFFVEVAQNLPQAVVLVLVKRGAKTVAGALMFRSDTVLYGRHWGCIEAIKHLHFETCFYQGIEYAIAQGLTRFEPGAGGEHKIARGFVPVKMQSSHWLSVNPFEQGIQGFLAEEKRMIDEYCDQVWQTTPYQTNEALRQKSQLLTSV